MQDLKARSVHAFLWGGGILFAKLAIQILAQVVLARVLGPEQYGLFAMAVIVISLSNFLADVGIAYGLIQRQDLTDAHIRFVFTWQVVIGALVSIAIVGLSGPIAGLFKEPRVADLLFTMAPICFVQAATAVSVNMLKRDMDFKTLQIGQSVGYLVGYVGVGIPLALAGWQVMSLVCAWLVQVTLTFALLFVRVKHRVTPLFLHSDAKGMAGFGVKALATNLVNWMISNVDRVVIARTFQSTDVGLYTTPYNLVYTPTMSLMSVIQPVMYSACAKVQGQEKSITNAYLTLVAAVCLFAMPVFLVIATVAETFVLALYGLAWRDAARVLTPMALSMPLYMLWNITTPPLWTNGRTRLEFLMQSPLVFIWAVASVAAANHSMTAVAWAVFGLMLLRLVIFAFAVSRVTGAGFAGYLRAIQGGVLVSLALSATAWGVDFLAVDSPTVRLGLVILACSGTYVAIVRLRLRVIYPPLGDLLYHRGMQASGRLAGITRWLLPHHHEKK
jgi:lipopolysaccharide exporter